MPKRKSIKSYRGGRIERLDHSIQVTFDKIDKVTMNNRMFYGIRDTQIIFNVQARNVEDAIRDAEDRFESLCGSEVRPKFKIVSVTSN